MWNSSIIVKSGTHSAWSRLMANIFVHICLFSGVAEPEYAGDIKLTRSITLRGNKPKNFIFSLFFCIYLIIMAKRLYKYVIMVFFVAIFINFSELTMLWAHLIIIN